MKIVIIGGHLSPALAVIQKLKNENIFYIGRKHTFEGDNALSLEYRQISKLKIPFYAIKTARLQRKFTKQTIPSLLKFPIGFYQSRKILKIINPDVIIGFGGYVSLPVIIAASLLKIPIIIHEQTLGAGFTNKLASHFASKICISWNSSAKYFPPNKTILTGIPLREEVTKLKNKKWDIDNRPLIFITGGSSGAHFINSLIEKKLLILLNKYKIFHQTGDAQEFKDFDNLIKIRRGLNNTIKLNYTVKKFLHSEEIAETISKSTLIIGRSGINTVTELIYFEKPALLIPLPFAQANEQLVNAEFLKKIGLGDYIKQNDLNDDLFINKINEMINNINNYKLKESVLIEKASDNVVKVIYDVAKKKST